MRKLFIIAALVLVACDVAVEDVHPSPPVDAGTDAVIQDCQTEARKLCDERDLQCGDIPDFVCDGRSWSCAEKCNFARCGDNGRANQCGTYCDGSKLAKACEFYGAPSAYGISSRCTHTPYRNDVDRPAGREGCVLASPEVLCCPD